MLQLYALGTATHQNTTLNPPNLNSGLVGHWTFDGKDMIKNVADTSGQGNTGYMVAAATSSQQVAGVLGQGLKFNGTSQYVKVNDSSSLEPTSALSISAWVNPTVSNPTDRGLFSEWNGSAGFMMYLSSGKLRCYVDGTNSQSIATLSTANKWYYLTCSWDGTTIRGYINGVLDGTAAYSAPSSVYLGFLEIGTYLDRSNSILNGSIDDGRFYNRALSAAEVLQLYKLGH